jgi:hypothetical protein
MFGLFTPFKIIRWMWRALKKGFTFWRRWRKTKKEAEAEGAKDSQTSLIEAIKDEIVDELTDKK